MSQQSTSRLRHTTIWPARVWEPSPSSDGWVNRELTKADLIRRNKVTRAFDWIDESPRAAPGRSLETKKDLDKAEYLAILKDMVAKDDTHAD